MKGLLYKEWATLTSSYKQTVFFIAFLYGGISILTGQTGMKQFTAPLQMWI